MRGEEGYFQVGAVLFFCDAVFFECAVEVVDYLVAVGALVVFVRCWSLADCRAEEVAEFLHDGECGSALPEEEGVSIEVGEIEEEGFEEGLFDDCLEFFKALVWSFQCLL